MEITISINCENEIFEENPHIELARILDELALQVRNNGIEESTFIRDINGNQIGYLRSF